jgi:hypothetical protein
MLIGESSFSPLCNLANEPSIEHAYRQSMPDSYGTALGGMMSGMPGTMGINNLPGSQMLMYGRGMGNYGVSRDCRRLSGQC